MAVSLLLGLAMVDSQKQLHLRLAGGLTAVLANWVLILTYSRGAWVAVSIGCLAYVTTCGFVLSKRFVRNLIVTVVVAILLASNLQYVIARVGTVGDITGDKSIANRITMWKTGIDFMGKYPMFGVGLGKCGVYTGKHLDVSAKTQRPASAVNNYITFGVETGVVSLFLLILVHSYGVLIGCKRAKDSPLEQLYARASLVAVLATSVAFGMFSYNLTKLYFCVFWMFLGLTVGWKAVGTTSRLTKVHSSLFNKLAI
jgi:O-antigen ligase